MVAELPTEFIGTCSRSANKPNPDPAAAMLGLGSFIKQVNCASESGRVPATHAGVRELLRKIVRGQAGSLSL